MIGHFMIGSYTQIFSTHLILVISERVKCRRRAVPSCVTEIRWVSKFFFSEKLKNLYVAADHEMSDHDLDHEKLPIMT